KHGSSAALSPIIAALDDDPTVASSALFAVQELRTPEALPRLIILLSSPQPWLRGQVVKTLRAFGPSVAAHMPTLRTRLATENDPQVKGELQQLIDSLNVRNPQVMLQQL